MSWTVTRRRILQAGTALGVAALGVFPAARRAHAEGYDIWEGECPSYAENHDCSPGCGSSTIFPDACELEGEFAGFHKDDGETWTLRPNECHMGSYDGWLWRFDGSCGTCDCYVERRCHDGFRRLESGWVQSICRWNTDCGCQGAVDWPTVQRGANGADVRAIQLLLRWHGYDPPLTADFDLATEQSVQDFQTDSGLSGDGAVDAETWAMLVVTIRQGDNGRAVQAVRRELNKYGYSLPVDGVFDELVAAAVREFQRQNELTVDGTVGQNTWRTLTGGAT